MLLFSYQALFQTVPEPFGNRPSFEIVVQFVQVLLQLEDAHRFCRFFFVFLKFIKKRNEIRLPGGSLIELIIIIL